MDLCFVREKAEGYKSPSQIARVLTEDWAARNLFCPSCKQPRLQTARDNTKVIDFVCDDCSETYQLKSQNKPLGEKILDSAYGPMIESIKNNRTPNLFLLHYNSQEYCAETLLIVPRYFLTLSCIEPRKPLSPNARRAGWIGCNIVLKEIPVDGKIAITKDRKVSSPETVKLCYERFRFLSEKNYDVRGWTADILKVIRELGKKDFTLAEAYSFDKQLQLLHPDNKNIRPKIRQQLQILRDRGILEFRGKGRYSFR
ncbi:MAG TPA: DpnI domain-containing protein [Thermodesulfovibrionales bacterium]|nr:DpnI domain-containing protein [Thermodesulfovibrionales bacterium]